MLIAVLKHRALNTLVNDKQSPQEQLGVFYHTIWKPVLSKEVCQTLEALLTMEKKDFYKQELIKCSKKKKR